MNPWLEGFWGDVHTSLTTYSRDAIQRQLPGDLQARMEEYLVVEEPGSGPNSSRRRISPDIFVGHSNSPLAKSTAPAATLIESTPDDLQEPIRFRLSDEPQTLREIQIVDVKAGRRVITAIEFISPANKTETGRAHYQRKQMEFIAAGVNLVEIDLLRFGHWVVSTEESQYPPSCRDPYRICVRRGNPISDREAYRVSYAFPLPSIRIPLRPGDEDVRLPLQTILNQAYENGRYGNDIDYSKPPEPPLEQTDADWITAWLKQLADEAEKP